MAVRRAMVIGVVLVVGLATFGSEALPASARAVPPMTTATWHVQTSPNPSATRFADLYDVACPSTSNCVAVGQSSDTAYKNQARLLERWNGSTWSIQSTPNPAGNPSTSFSSVACSSTSACTAVGTSYTANGDRALVERWNGSKWSLETAPTPSSGAAILYGVACPTATSCFAVGDSDATNGNPPLIEHWNGGSWSIQTVPHPTGVPFIFYSVACRATSDCTAVGEIPGSGGAASALAAHWNGSKWSVQTAALPSGGRSSYLNDVRCPSATQCLAVGDSYTPASGGLTATLGLAEVWNGHTWTSLAPPTPVSGAQDDFYGVACPGVSKCVIVGSYDSTTVTPLAMRWDGSTFAVDDTPGVGTFSYLYSVNCNGSNACVAVGAGEPSTLERTLVERSP